MFEKLVGQLNIQDDKKKCETASSPFENLKKTTQNKLLRSLSERALNLYQKKTDIKNFTKLALSNPEDLSHNEIAKNQEIDEYDILFDLTNNDEFLKDLGL